MQQSSSNTLSLTRQDTAIMKGIAIIAMLCHHLYGCTPEGVAPYSGFWQCIGLLGKICVSLFLFCSGFGMAKQFQKVSGAKETVRFLIKRFRKFYLNYWVIFLIFVPLGVFVFHRSLHAAYGENADILKCTLIDIMGMQGFQSYNVTWWFNQLIILLYLLFPFMYLYARWKPWLALLTSIALLPFTIHVPYIPAEICTWQLSFMAGICWQLYEDKLPKLSAWITEHNRLFSFISIALAALLIWLRVWQKSPLYAATSMDAFLSMAIALTMISIFRHLPRTSVSLAFLGKHSANIYLIHTFFNMYWFPHLLHHSAWMRWGCNFLILMALCLAISIMLEFLKQKISALFLYISKKNSNFAAQNGI